MSDTREIHGKLESLQGYIEGLEKDRETLYNISERLECDASRVLDVFNAWYDDNVEINVNQLLSLVDRAYDACNTVRGSVEDASDAVSRALSEIEYLDINDNQYEIDDVSTELSDMLDEIKNSNTYKSANPEVETTDED
tara:strand:+ start:2527 stop:2943 length:417 start_codon:yes stop_codon:yes gene_type:complete